MLQRLKNLSLSQRPRYFILVQNKTFSNVIQADCEIIKETNGRRKSIYS